ncbi:MULTISPECIES: ABC transporter ATP-binding protein [Ensifer]|uniref:ATP-binding cassette domain-containing protein n=1 Tax=Ensifer canadensis TaxID=555315 RepID=A0AAW4FGY4_9HYPH|nr:MULTISPECIES: ABC transporter ATP-binding protein [Ensifer]KQU98557.1 ABC transporter ATP-binding protein [Ensifer sp. Root31]KQW63317.1 ABC transporter ATP-binding protein [Ensifer sp. Root1252]KQW85331.1 ABC transporter ATP-binding protein [Ensifer sp. Root127]KQY75723.1 ABC transporter ATP-binding protein [Ensifer sp. Root142]KRC84137.1 ABC transporter ATP-binding protein [Ensifer sp. Root231]
MSARDRKQHAVDSDTISGILKRVIAENGRDHIRGYVFAIACLAVVAVTTGFTASIMETVINEAFANRNAGIVLLVCGSIFGAFVLRGFATYGQAVALSKIGNNIVARYQRRLYAHLMALSVGYFNETRSAQLAAQISQNVSGIRDVLNLTVTSIARDLLTLIGLVGVMFAKDWLLSIIVFVAAPPLLLGLRYVSRRLRSATRESIEVNSRVLGAMQETIQGISIVKAFTMERELRGKVEAIIERAENRANRIARLSERTAPMTETFAGLAISCVLAYSAFRAIYAGVPPGAFFAFVVALLMAYDPARRLARLQVSLERAAVNARMVYEILDTVPHQRDKPDAKQLEFHGANVELRDVRFRYANGDEILKGVSFVAEGGKTTALVGPSGAGKSTVISLVPRFYDPASGQILIDGQDIADVTKQSLRNGIAYVSQQPYLFEGSIRDNIRYGRPDATDAEIEEAARLAYAHDFILTQPQGYDTPVGENGVTMSGGQRQRLSIARALVRNAPILLLDEATSALDTESEAAVQKALDEAMHGRTVIVIAHRLSTVVNADKIIVMKDGLVVEEGTHEDLARRQDGLYARLHNLQGKAPEASADAEI